MKILIIGNGYIGNRCLGEWPDAVIADQKVNTVEEVVAMIDKYQADVVLNAAGVIGQPNVDWCETHQLETINGNTILPFLIAEACQRKNIYLLHIGSGCIFYGDSPEEGGWREEDFANPAATYTKAKYAADLMLSTLPNVGIARIRMPLDFIPYRGNIIDKLARYKQIINVENSLTVLEDMVQVFRALLEKQASGIFHVTNPGAIAHKQIIDWYNEFVDPNHTNEWIAEEDLLKLGLVSKKRSNNVLQSDNLTKLGITMRPAAEAVRDAVIKYASFSHKNS